MIKSIVNKLANAAGYHISKLQRPSEPTASVEKVTKPEAKRPDPKDYTTTTVPMEVPCQKETYYFVLNNYVSPTSKVLDVGAGLGYGMAILSVKAKEVHGIDIDKKSNAYAEQEYIGRNPKIKSIKYFDGYAVPYKDSSFDVVTCVDVIEHVEDYNRFIDELLRVSRGVVIFSTPNRRVEFTNPDGTPRNYWHLREWSHKELDEILSKHQAKVDWFLIDGPFEGPFKIRKKVSKYTLVLLPVLHKNRLGVRG